MRRKGRFVHASTRQQALMRTQLAPSESQSPSDDCCTEGAALGGLKDILRRSLGGTLGAAALEGAVGLLISQKPLLGKRAPGRACSLLPVGSVWQKARISGRLIPICVSSSSCKTAKEDSGKVRSLRTAGCTAALKHQSKL